MDGPRKGYLHYLFLLNLSNHYFRVLLWSLRGGEGQEPWDINASQEGGCSEQAYFNRTHRCIILLYRRNTFLKQMLHSGPLYFLCVLKLSPSPFCGSIYFSVASWRFDVPGESPNLIPSAHLAPCNPGHPLWETVVFLSHLRVLL